MIVLDRSKGAIFRERVKQVQGVIGDIVNNIERLGILLKEIRDKKLYEHDDEHPEQTYDEWCKRVLGFSRRRLNKIIEESDYAHALREVFGESMPQLSGKAIQEASKAETPSKAASDIRQAIRHTGSATPSAIKAAREKRKPTMKPAKAAVIDAETGQIVHADATKHANSTICPHCRGTGFIA